MSPEQELREHVGCCEYQVVTIHKLLIPLLDLLLAAVRSPKQSFF